MDPTDTGFALLAFALPVAGSLWLVWINVIAKRASARWQAVFDHQGSLRARIVGEAGTTVALGTVADDESGETTPPGEIVSSGFAVDVPVDAIEFVDIAPARGEGAVQFVGGPSRCDIPPGCRVTLNGLSTVSVARSAQGTRVASLRAGTVVFVRGLRVREGFKPEHARDVAALVAGSESFALSSSGETVGLREDVATVIWPVPLFALGAAVSAIGSAEVAARWFGLVLVAIAAVRVALRTMSVWANTGAPDPSGFDVGLKRLASRSREPEVIARSTRPFWLAEMRGAEHWLVCESPSTSGEVLIADFGAAANDRERITQEEGTVDAWRLADEISLQTGTVPTVIARLDAARRRAPWDSPVNVRAFVERYARDPKGVVAVIAGRRDGRALELHVQRADGSDATTFLGTLEQVTAETLNWLDTFAHVRASRAASPLVACAEGYASSLYAEALDAAISARCGAAEHASHVTYRQRLYAQLTEYAFGDDKGREIAALAWTAEGLRAAANREAPDERRTQLRDLVLRRAESSDTWQRLAPAILFGLGFDDEAGTRRNALLAALTPAGYRGDVGRAGRLRAWLESLQPAQ